MDITSESHPPVHRFDQPVEHPLTAREQVELEYAAHFIPFLKAMQQVAGHEQVIAVLQALASQGVRDYAQQIVRAAGKNDLSVIKQIFSPNNPGLSQNLTMTVVEDTDDIYAVNVSECLLAEVFRRAGVAEFGRAYLCCDELFTECINPNIGLEIEGTLMEGHPSCPHRWFVRV